MIPRQDEQGPIPALWYALLALLVVTLALAGYVGFRLYPRFGLPEAEGAALLVLAGAAGIAAFFSPCSFPLLATILAREVGVDDPRASRRTATALRFAAALAVGAAIFLVLAGIVVAMGSGALLRAVTFGSPTARVIRALVGIVLVALGLMQLGVIPSGGFHAIERLVRPLQRRQAELRRASPDLGYALFGFGYVFAGFG